MPTQITKAISEVYIICTNTLLVDTALDVKKKSFNMLEQIPKNFPNRQSSMRPKPFEIWSPLCMLYLRKTRSNIKIKIKVTNLP